MTAHDPDAARMLRVRDGDESAFRELVERHHRAVINTIYRATGDAAEAEDLAQRVFIQIYRSAHRYEPTSRFTTWMFTIVHNLIRNEYRRRNRHPTDSLEALAALPDLHTDLHANDPAREVALNELQQRIADAIESLPANQRMAVILARYEGLSYDEIARVLNCSVSAVKSLLHRARETLKTQLHPYL
ncbi:MAG: sigma-70 family RNA polymerase sigma factor [Verrucomicrobiae bacterium]|nr:sigma-70 family RNA polymerase sigma factor [Verrucomicrobiae bacterium]